MGREEGGHRDYMKLITFMKQLPMMGLKAVCKGVPVFIRETGQQGAKSFPKVSQKKTGRAKLSSTPEPCFIHQDANESKDNEAVAESAW